MSPLTKQLLAAACALLCLLPTITRACDGCYDPPEIRVESPFEGEWNYVAVREQYRATFAWARSLREDRTTATLALVTDAATSGTLPRRMAALLAAREVGAPIPQTPEQREEITSAAMQLAKDETLGWGAEALWRDHVPGMRSTTRADLPDYLVAQLGEDSIANNATRAADLLRLGMISDRERYVDALAGWWRGNAPPHKEDLPQEALMVGSVLLLHAALDTETFSDPSNTWGSLALDDRTGNLDGWKSLSPSTQSAVLDVAFRFSSREGYPENFLQVVAGCGRRRAWSVLEGCEPLAEEQLLQVMLSDQHSRYDRLRAAVILLARDPEVLAAPRGLDAMTEIAAMNYWRANRLWELTARNSEQSAEEENCCDGSHTWLLYECFDSPEAIPAPFPRPTMQRVREKLVTHLRGALANEVEPQRQIGIWSFLLNAEDPESYPVIAQAAVSNLIADDESGNASAGYWALDRVGEEGIRAAHAGMRVSVEIGDWQLAAKCAEFLEGNDPEFRKSQYPGVMALMARQLMDDDVEGNAAAAMRYLADCGEAARGYLLSVLDSGDEQGARYAAVLLGE